MYHIIQVNIRMHSQSYTAAHNPVPTHTNTRTLAFSTIVKREVGGQWVTNEKRGVKSGESPSSTVELLLQILCV